MAVVSRLIQRVISILHHTQAYPSLHDLFNNHHLVWRNSGFLLVVMYQYLKILESLEK